jgi:hypothetical protein
MFVVSKHSVAYPHVFRDFKMCVPHIKNLVSISHVAYKHTTNILSTLPLIQVHFDDIKHRDLLLNDAAWLPA